MSRTTARDRTIATAQVACNMRKARKVVMLGANRQPSVAMQKMMSPPRISGRRPNLSASGPMKICMTALVARKIATDSCTTR